MKFSQQRIPDVVLIEPPVYEDERGFFLETWRQDRFLAAGIDAKFVQDNRSRSTRGTLRGLHYQLNSPQGKLIRVTHGEIFDVAVDIRRSSTTFGQWVGVSLSAGNHRALWIPPGFAHGFLVQSNYADFEYRMTDYYAREDERCIAWDDPDINIDWPRTADSELKLSDKDRRGVRFADAECHA